jgi:hypothetical protein
MKSFYREKMGEKAQFTGVNEHFESVFDAEFWPCNSFSTTC